MKLYHYTNSNNMRSIVLDKKISAGRIVPRSASESARAISLTDDRDPSGHGLTNGAIITEAQAIALKYGTRDGQNIRSVDNTKYCFVVEISEQDPHLKKATDINSDPMVIKALEIAGYFPHDADVSEADILAGMVNLDNGTWKGKGETWWYYFNDLDLSVIENVMIRMMTPNGWYEEAIAEVEKSVRSKN